MHVRITIDTNKIKKNSPFIILPNLQSLALDANFSHEHRCNKRREYGERKVSVALKKN